VVNDEQAFIQRVDEGDPEEFATLLARPTTDEERVLRLYLGDARFQRLHSLAVRRLITRGPAVPPGNVVVIPGIMASELATVDREGDRDHIWVSKLRIVMGQLDRLRLAENGLDSANREYDVVPIGIMKRYYGEMLLTLYQGWNVRAFFYDWRKDVSVTADELRARITGWFGEDAPVHIVAHSLGGLVSRAFIMKHGDRWKRMWDPGTSDRQPGTNGGRLIMLGTPNLGSFGVVQMIVGLEGVVRMLAKFDLHHNVGELVNITNTFPSTSQMLPALGTDGDHAFLFDAHTYGDRNVSQRQLDAAKAFQQALANAPETADAERMIYVAGSNRATLDGVDPARIDDDHGYHATFAGDTRVTHERGRIGSVPMVFVDETHAELPNNDQILGAVDDLLKTGMSSLPSKPPPPAVPRDRSVNPIDVLIKDRDAAEARAEVVAERTRLRLLGRGAVIVRPRTEAPPEVSVEEERMVTKDDALIRDLVMTGFAGVDDDAGRNVAPTISGGRPTIEIRVAVGQIEYVDDIPGLRKIDPPVDAIAVGHYMGVRPQKAEQALDRAISQKLLEKWGDTDGKIADDDLLLTQLTDRGTLVGELGRIFLIDDPRVGGGEGGKDNVQNDRVIAIAGMDVPGRFGMPELTVVARELCWSLGRMGKRHLAAVVIGAGNGNMTQTESVTSWMRGVEMALGGLSDKPEWHLRRITFINRDLDKLVEIHQAIIAEKERHETAGRLEIHYDRYPTKTTSRDESVAQFEEEIKDFQKWFKESGCARDSMQDGGETSADPVPTRVTLDLEGSTYHYSAITVDAAAPERTVPLDPELVKQASEELAQEATPDMQLERGQFLGRLLLPNDLRDHLRSDAPIVMMLDPVTARVPWEMVAQPDPGEVYRGMVHQNGDDVSPDVVPSGEFNRFRFLGTARGFTRQLRTTFAPPPEPPPPPRRKLRVLVVADPAEDASLPGAEEEGIVVADLFEAYNRVFGGDDRNAVQVVRLFGPSDAKRTTVLRELMIRTYDVLHFAGHCFYDRDDPAASGWIFRANPLECLSARELNRIDRIPKFVFSNACESGITQDRIDLRSPELPPSFAEAFFLRGVANFVCTAWPVDDLAARQFATAVYARMLGMVVDDKGSVVGPMEPAHPMPIHQAMQEARAAIASTPNGALTWGAYQHYGNPFFRLFAAERGPKSTNRRAAGATRKSRSARVAAETAAGRVQEEGDGGDIL
jgi:CHAT domain